METNTVGTYGGNMTEMIGAPFITVDPENMVIDLRDRILKAIYISIGSTGILGNALVIVVLGLSLKKRSNNVSYMLIIHQSVLDFLAAVFLLATTIFADDGRYYQTPMDDAYCRIWIRRAPLWLCLNSSTVNLVFLTLERYLAIVYPIRHKMSVSYAKGFTAIACVWAIGLTTNLPPAILTSYIVNGKCVLYVFKSLDGYRANGIVTVSLFYFIPIFVLVFCYGRMVLALRQRVGPLNQTNGGGGGGGGTTVQQQSSTYTRGKRNIIKTLIVVSAAFILCVSWNQIFFFLFNVGVLRYSAFQSAYYHFSVAAVFANCCVNPIIYAAKYEEFQKGVRKLICGCGRATKGGDGQSITGFSTSGTHS